MCEHELTLSPCELSSLGLEKSLKGQDTRFSLIFSLCLGSLMGGGGLEFTSSATDIYFG